MKKIKNIFNILITITTLSLIFCFNAFSKDIEYKGEEVDVFVTPGEPTQVQFPSKVLGGFKKKLSAISLDKKANDLVIFATEKLSEEGESLIIRLDDGRSYTIRVKKGDEDQRNTLVRIIDKTQSILKDQGDANEDSELNKGQMQFAPATKVSGLMR